MVMRHVAASARYMQSLPCPSRKASCWCHYGIHAICHLCHLSTACAVQGYGNDISLTADAKISAQRSLGEIAATDDSVKAFSPTRQPNEWLAGTGADPGQPQLPPITTMVVPVSAGSGLLPTPHAVPHQTPPAAAVAVPNGSASSSSGMSGSSDGSSESSEVSYTHVTPIVGHVSDEGSDSDSPDGAATASSLLVSSGTVGLPETGRPRQSQPAQRR